MEPRRSPSAGGSQSALRAQEDPLTTLYFPDYVDGGGWSVQLALSHIADEDAAVLVTAYDREGQPIRGSSIPKALLGSRPWALES